MHKSTTSKRKLPDTWLVVFFILVVIAILTWIVPSGSFDYETIDIDGTARKVAIAGSYHEISKSEVSATGLLGLFASLYEGCVSAADIIFVIMTCAATFGVIVKTGAFHAFIGRVVQKNGSRSLILIPDARLWPGRFSFWNAQRVLRVLPVDRRTDDGSWI